MDFSCGSKIYDGKLLGMNHFSYKDKKTGCQTQAFTLVIAVQHDGQYAQGWKPLTAWITEQEFNSIWDSFVPDKLCSFSGTISGSNITLTSLDF